MKFLAFALMLGLIWPAVAQVLPADPTNGPRGDARLEPVLESTAAPEPFPLFFAHGSDNLTAASEVTITAAVRAARMLGVTDFAVTGHANEARSAEYNMELSLRRANAVRESLIAHGVASARISVAGRISLAGGAEARPANSRVEIILLK
jgi:OOP family OmpA-OmpF porin